MLKKIISSFLLLLICLPIFSQSKGYEITVKIKNITDTVLYLVGNYGEDVYIFDSARVNKRFVAIFTGKQELYSGIYSIQNREKQNLFDLIIDKSREFSISTSKENIFKKRKIVGSAENQSFFEVEKMAMLTKLEPTVREETLEAFSDFSPNSLLSKFIKAITPLKIPEPIQEDSIQKQSYIITHYFDNIAINDARLLRVPFVSDKILSFFTAILPQDADTLSYYIHSFLNNLTNREVFDYYLEKLFKYYSSYTSPPELDGVSVGLYDSFCTTPDCKFIEPEMRRVVYNKIERKRRLLPGETVKPLLALDTAGECRKSSQLTTDFIILWFWEPDCGSCVELTPELSEFYKEYKTDLNFEVYAVALTEDEEAWLDFIKENNLDWINVSCVHGMLDYDFIDFFDIITTPSILLMDKNHKIISRELSFSKLKKLMEK